MFGTAVGCEEPVGTGGLPGRAKPGAAFPAGASKPGSGRSAGRLKSPSAPSNSSGEKVLTLPEAREWYDLFRNKAVSGKSKVLKLQMERGQTEIFFIGSKADFERYQKIAAN